MPEKKDEKKDRETTIEYVRLSGIADLARSCTAFGDGARAVFTIKSSGQYRMCCPGPKLDGTRIMFYVDSKKSGNFLAYRPKNAMDEQILELRDTVLPESMKRDTIVMPIIELMTNPFREGKEKKQKETVKLVQTKTPEALIKGAILKTLEEDHIGKVYSFTYKSKRYIGTFSLMEEEDMRIFCYAQTDSKGMDFFRYNYNTDTVEPTDTFGDHSFMYVRIINLAEPFSFFKV